MSELRFPFRQAYVYLCSLRDLLINQIYFIMKVTRSDTHPSNRQLFKQFSITEL
jgi:hypothetical protein